MAKKPKGLWSAAAALFDEAKHKRGSGGKFASKGGAKPAGKQGGSVATAHALFDKMKGKPKGEVLAAAQAAGINPNTAKTQLYHWQKKQAAAALGAGPHTKADLQAAAAKAIGVKAAAPKPTPAPEHKGYDHIVNGPGTAQEKAKKLTNQFFDDEAKLAKKSDLPKLQKSYDEALAKIVKPQPAPAPAPKPTPTPVAAPAAKAPPDIAKLGPTKYVHALADHMAGAPKKDVLAAAVKAGVNKSTAGVQYGKWAKAKAGDPPQLKKSPEPAALKAKDPAKMTDKELDEATASYGGKLNYKSESAAMAPKPYNSQHDYHDHQGGKALTAKMGTNEVYTNSQQGKTFYKSSSGSIYEHTGNSAGPMTKVHSADGATSEAHYDPATKMVYAKIGGVLKPVPSVKTPVFKLQQPPPDESNHVFSKHAWSKVNGVQNPNSKGVTAAVQNTHTKAGVTYNETSPAVISYTGSGYQSINKGLRDSKGATVSPRAKEIDSLIAKSSFKEETIMWRGVGSSGTTWNGAPPPIELDDHGFTSVSFRPDVAKGFSNQKTIFRVRVPKGFPGLNVAIGQPGSGKAGLQSEAEVLLPRGTTYRVVERHKQATDAGWHGNKYDVVDLEPVLPAWYVAKYGNAAA